MNPTDRENEVVRDVSRQGDKDQVGLDLLRRVGDSMLLFFFFFPK